MEPSTAELASLEALYDAGLYTQAHRAASRFGPLQGWRGPEAMVLAGRIAHHVGAPRLANAIHLRAGRTHRDHPMVSYYHALALWHRRGPLEAWRSFRRDPEPRDGGELEAHTWALRAAILAALRDFDQAERHLRRAFELSPNDPWVHVEQAFFYRMADQYDKALKAAQEALSLRPWYRPAVESAADLLLLQGRDEEAVTLLGSALERCESASLAATLVNLLIELDRCAEAQEALRRVEELSPLQEKAWRQWIAARRADCAYYLGDLEQARTEAAKVDGKYHKSMAERLAAPGTGGRRLRLAVPFVRQHHQTCAPATIAALCQFWSVPVDHLALADEICYDGTPPHRERAWLEEHGWVARDFVLSRDAALALIERGLPFTLTTVEADSAHLQAVVGYDTCLETMIVRDPSQRHLVDFLTDATIQRYRGTGPLGRTLVPRAEAHRLKGVPLPDADRYDRFHALVRALDRHAREEAQGCLADLVAADPGHRVTWLARRSLAIHDGDTPGILQANEELLRLFPESEPLERNLLHSLRDLRSRDERLCFLEAICARKGSSPFFLQELARELLPDARQHRRVERLLRRTLSLQAANASALQLLGDLHWDRGERREALEAYRFAACLDDKNESAAEAYFRCARHLKETDAAMAYLEGRFERHGGKSGAPARTLFWALEQLDRLDEGFRRLEEGMRRRPDDGELVLHAARAHVRNGRFERGAELLAQAEGRCQRADWLEAAARSASMQGDPGRARDLWRQVLEVEPCRIAAHREYASLLAATEGQSAAIEHLRAASLRFPHNLALRAELIAWLKPEDPAGAEAIAAEMVRIDPLDAWARRERALLLLKLQRLDEALEEVLTSVRIEPGHSYAHSVLARVHEARAELPLAREAYRKAVCLSADNTTAISGLVRCSQTGSERREALALVRQELERQTLFESGLLTFREEAVGILTREEILACLREGYAARPDLWYAGTALIRQLLDMGQLDEAHERARWLTERFPLSAGSWVELAEVERQRGDDAAAAAAFEKSLEVNPSWSVPARKLGDLYERLGDPQRARSVLERAVSFDPLEARNHGCLADVLVRLGEKEAAVARLERAIRLDPAYDWAWDKVKEWSPKVDRPGLSLELAEELTRQRPGDPAVWVRCSIELGDRSIEEQLEALDRAIAIAPRHAEAHDRRAELLARHKRFDEALAACDGPHWNGPPPITLRGRAAWVEAERGRFDEAKRRMRLILADDPTYYWGWKNLADWCEQTRDAAGNLEAAEKLVELQPRSESPYGYRGQARLQGGDRAGAREDFRHALAIDAGYLYAGRQLFDLEIADREVEAAARALSIFGPHCDPDERAAHEIRLAAARPDLDAAHARLAELARQDGARPWTVRQACDALKESEGGDGLLRELERICLAPGASSTAATVWVELAAESSWKRALLAAERLLDAGSGGLPAVGRLLRLLADHRQPARLRRFVRRHRRRLRADDGLWGSAGYALATIGDAAGAARWMRDWRGRASVESWMLDNLADALWVLGRFVEHDAVRTHALTLKPDFCRPYHLLWLAFEAVRRGDDSRCVELLGQADSLELTDYARFLRAQVQVLLQRKPAPAWQLDWDMSRGLLELGDQMALRQAHWLTRHLRSGFWHRWAGTLVLLLVTPSWLRRGDPWTLLTRQCFALRR